MIIRKYWYRCENCGIQGFFKWGLEFPESRKCPGCEGKLRVTGHRDFSSTKLAIAREMANMRGIR